MAFQFDGVGYIAINGALNTSGAFRIRLPDFEYRNGNYIIMRRGSTAGVNISIETGGKVVARNSSARLEVVIPNIQEGDLITGFDFERAANDTATLTANGVSASGAFAGTYILQGFGGWSSSSTELVYDGKFEGGQAIITAADGYSKTFDFTPESGTNVQDGQGNQTGTLEGFTTGGFVANSSVVPPATTSSLILDIDNDLPASGSFQVYAVKVSDKTTLYQSTASFNNGQATLTLPITNFPVGTQVDWFVIDATNQKCAGARQATVAS
ncbi:hypothetical protein ACFO4O_04390 [Glaciecola siphonariae]|uniref:Uncharacterized protein n=1 Tax=Glaciecola siphonariae TaxID=521012 RepID=A0ABV9LSB8_9ALTE